MKESSFESIGGIKIATRSWAPAGTPRAVVILVHGFNAHSAYWAWAAEQFAARGLACYALDLRGRGKSEGERFYVDDFSEWLADVDGLVRQARSENPVLPVFVLGHSAGGVIAASYVYEHQNEVAGLISESFAYDVGLPDAAALILKGISHLAPHLHVYSLKNEIFSRDPEAVARMNADPLIEKESQPAETSAEMLKAADRLTEHFPKFTVPVLIIHGTADKATRPAGSQRFYELAGAKDKTLKLYNGHFHDLLNDVDKELVMADIQVWIDEHLKAAKPA